MTQDIGIRGSRALGSFLAQSQTLGPLLQAAFPVVAAVAFFEILSTGYTKILDLTSALAGWNEQAQHMYATLLRLNQQQLDFNEHLAVESIHLAEAGLRGTALSKQKEIDLDKERILLQNQYNASKANEDRIKKQIQGTDRQVPVAIPHGGIETITEHEGPDKKTLADLNRQLEDAMQKTQRLHEEMQKLTTIEIPRQHADTASDTAEAAERAAKEKARAEEEAARKAQQAWHAKVIAELDDAERLAKEKMRMNEEDAVRTREFYKNVEAEEKAADRENERLQQEQLRRTIELWNKQQRAVEEAAKKEVEYFQRSFNGIDSALNRSVVSWMNGQETFGRAMQRAWTGIADNAVENLLKITEKLVEQKVIQTVVAQTQVSTQAAAAAQSASLTEASMLRQQLAAAKAAAGKAWNAFADIPIVGPELGAVAAGATFAAIMAFEQGGIMPNDNIAMLHAREMVLPAHIADSVQRAADGGTMGSGGNHTFNFNHNGSGSGEQVRTSSKEFFRMAKRELRRMNR